VVCPNEAQSSEQEPCRQSMKYRVEQSFIGVHIKIDGTSDFIRLQPGTVFSVRSKGRSGMVNVMYDRRILAVFERDIQERAIQIKAVGN
jgi:hypothetical protein